MGMQAGRTGPDRTGPDKNSRMVHLPAIKLPGRSCTPRDCGAKRKMFEKAWTFSAAEVPSRTNARIRIDRNMTPYPLDCAAQARTRPTPAICRYLCCAGVAYRPRHAMARDAAPGHRMNRRPAGALGATKPETPARNVSMNTAGCLLQVAVCSACGTRHSLRVPYVSRTTPVTGCGKFIRRQGAFVFVRSLGEQAMELMNAVSPQPSTAACRPPEGCLANRSESAAALR